MSPRRAARRWCSIGLVAALGALLASAHGTVGAEEPAAEPAREAPCATAPALEADNGCTADGAPANCVPEAAGQDVEPAEEQAAERILDYRSSIVVATDGRLTVTETFAVVSAGDQIKRGIYRDFPTDYSRMLTIGDVSLPILRSQVPFDVVEVQRDGHPEPYHTELQDNGVRVYIGDADVTLYWNVTGKVKPV